MKCPLLIPSMSLTGMENLYKKADQSIYEIAIGTVKNPLYNTDSTDKVYDLDLDELKL